MTLPSRPSYAAELVAKLHAERPELGAGPRCECPTCQQATSPTYGDARQQPGVAKLQCSWSGSKEVPEE